MSKEILNDDDNVEDDNTNRDERNNNIILFTFLITIISFTIFGFTHVISFLSDIRT